MQSAVEPKKSTAQELISEYIEIKDKLAKWDDLYAQKCAPDKLRLEEIQGKLHGMLQELGGDGRQALKTDKGTAYLSRIVTPRIIDREKYLDVVLDNYDTWGAGMLMLGAPKKEAIDDYMSSHDGQLPGGVETTVIVRCNIRRS
jgi:hypothetical protein